MPDDPTKPLPRFGDDLESFIVLNVAHELDDGDDKTARELVEMLLSEYLKLKYPKKKHRTA